MSRKTGCFLCVCFGVTGKHSGPRLFKRSRSRLAAFLGLSAVEVDEFSLTLLAFLRACACVRFTVCFTKRLWPSLGFSFDIAMQSCPNDNHSFWLSLWMVNNIGVTLLNKAAFASVDFKYPFFLSAVHMTCNSLGSQILFWTLRRQRGKGHSSTESPPLAQQLLGNIQRQSLDAAGKRLILAFSVIFSLNIAIGNVSLRYVTVNFNQVMRSLVPGVAMLMGMCLGKKFTLRRQLAIVPVMVG